MITKSNFYQISQSQIRHIRKLNQIANSTRTSLLNFDINPQKSLLDTRRKHTSSRNLRTYQQEREIKNENRKMIMTLFKISSRKTETLKNETVQRRGNYFYQEQRRKKRILSENKEIAKRIASQRSVFSKTNDERDFQQSRQLIRRIEKFNKMRKINNKLEENFRLKTQPLGSTWIDSQSNEKKKIAELIFKNKSTLQN